VMMETQKIKKQEATIELRLEKNPDILAQVAQLAKPPFTVGFAAETHQLVDYAKDKLKRKQLDMIAANQVGIEGSGFDSEDNALHVFWQNGDVEFPRCSKKQLARQLMLLITERYFEKKSLK